MKTKREIIKKFEEFNKEAKEILELSFQKQFQGSGVKISWSRKDKLLRSQFKGPSDESIKAFCNDLRKFIQGNDSLKIEKLTLFYQSNLVERKWKRMFGEQMSKIDTFLSNSGNCIFHGKNYSNKEILNVFLYGKFSHRTEGTKDEHDKLEKSPLYVMLKNSFVTVLHSYLILINNLIYINNLVLNDINKDED